jgi:hypothetical protein
MRQGVWEHFNCPKLHKLEYAEFQEEQTDPTRTGRSENWRRANIYPSGFPVAAPQICLPQSPLVEEHFHNLVKGINFLGA